LPRLALFVELKRERRAALDGAPAAERHLAVCLVDLARLGKGSSVVQVLGVRRQSHTERRNQVVHAGLIQRLPPLLVEDQQ
jgi:hypothetical protein